ncbi:MAG: efflux RND transporter periplasmic adaptor subunit [Pseudomonadota bacterium]
MHIQIKTIIGKTCFVLPIILAGCEKPPEIENTAPLREVRSVLVEAGSSVIERKFSGTLQAADETRYSFRVAGSIQNLPINVGQSVENGDLIAVLDDSDYQLEVERSRASVNEAESLMRNAKAEYERVRKLYEVGNSSKGDLDNARAASETAEASRVAAVKSLEIAQRNLTYTKLTSKADCQIASIPAETGENVSAGSVVVVASCGTEMEVKLDIPESAISLIENGAIVKISFPAIPGETFSGEVFEVGISSVEGGTTFPVTIRITEDDVGDLKSGLSAEVEFKFESPSGETIVVPAFAVSEDQDGRFVFILQVNNDRAEVIRTPVELGNVRQEGIEVLEGIKPGMRVVTAGVSVLRNGMRVKAPKK